MAESRTLMTSLRLLSSGRVDAGFVSEVLLR